MLNDGSEVALEKLVSCVYLHGEVNDGLELKTLDE